MRKIAKAMTVAVATVAILAGLQRLLMPKYTGRVIEGAFIKEYYQETTGHDLLILGDCEVYENISPMVLWEEYGIPSYIRGSANQLPAQSYYLLEDTLRDEKPKVVLWNVLAMTMGVQEKESYNRMTMEGMRWSSSKWKAIEETALENEHMVEYLFPLLRYHSRWEELEEDDIKYFFHDKTVSHNGYYMRCDKKPAETFPARRRKASYEFPEQSWEYLDKMETLCRENGIQLVLMKAPSLYPVWPEEYEVQIENYAQSRGLLYVNCLEEPIGLDYSQDTYDGGLHLNLYGAEKLARYLGGVLQAETGLEDHRGEEAFEKVWEEKLAFYNEQKMAQEKELETYGYLRQFTEMGGEN